MRLKNRVALITGGGSGIGLATALAFLREGARVAISDRCRESLNEARQQAAASGHELLTIEGDVSRDEDARRMVSETADHLGRIDILFNNAGILIEKPVHLLPVEDWDRVIDVNLKGVFLVSRHTIPLMLRQGSGVIVNTGSVNSIVADYGDPAYCASKGGVALLTRAMALDYARSNIRVNAICPGWVETRMFRQEADTRGLSLDDYRERAGREEPIGRIGRPEEIAALVVFLASDESSFVTGSLMVIDGGMTAI